MMDGPPISPDSSSSVLDERQKGLLRLRMNLESEKLLGIIYKKAETEVEKSLMVGKWTDLNELPLYLDCSGLTNGLCRKVGLPFPHGSQNQFNFTIATMEPKMGDFAFFGHEGDITKVYHVGMVYDDLLMIEARGKQEDSNFETGKVIFRARLKWEKYVPNFLGYRTHPKLL